MSSGNFPVTLIPMTDQLTKAPNQNLNETQFSRSTSGPNITGTGSSKHDNEELLTRGLALHSRMSDLTARNNPYADHPVNRGISGDAIARLKKGATSMKVD